MIDVIPILGHISVWRIAAPRNVYVSILCTLLLAWFAEVDV